jgi:hypothetical protein
MKFLARAGLAKGESIHDYERMVQSSTAANIFVFERGTSEARHSLT